MEPDFRMFGSYGEAKDAALEDGAATDSRTVLGQLYKQSGRYMFCTSLSIPAAIELVRLDSAKKGEDPSIRMNRPRLIEHSKSIARYLKDVEQYILPPITLNVDKPLQCYISRTPSQVNGVFINIPRGYQFNITDGQHRIYALKEIIETNAAIKDDGIGINIIFENDINKIHQDFADCAQTKPIPSSLRAAFDQRNPISDTIRRVISEVDFFKNRVDMTSQSISKTSLNIFTLNQVRFCVTEVLLGDSVQTSENLAKNIKDRFDRFGKEDWTKKIIYFYDKFTKNNNIWSAISENNLKYDIRDLRGRYVHLSATGLQVISRVGHYIMQIDDLNSQDHYIVKLANLDYNRTNSLWHNSIVASRTFKVTTQNSMVKQAVIHVKQEIGMELTDAENKIVGAKPTPGATTLDLFK